MPFRRNSITGILTLFTISKNLVTSLKTVCSADGKMTIYFPYSRDARLVDMRAGNCEQKQITQTQNIFTKDFTITLNPYECGYLKPIKGNFSVETNLEFSVSLNTSPGIALIARKYKFEKLNCPIQSTYKIEIDKLTTPKKNSVFELTSFSDGSFSKELIGPSKVGDMMFFKITSDVLDKIPAIKYAPVSCKIQDRRSGRGFVLYDVNKNICERTELSFSLDWSRNSWMLQYKMVMFRTSYAKYRLEMKICLYKGIRNRSLKFHISQKHFYFHSISTQVLRAVL